MPELVFLKLGGSIITDKKQPNTPKPEIIKQMAIEIKAALDARQDNLQLVIGHGSGSFGHAAAAKYQITHGALSQESWYGLAQVGAAAARLNRIVMDIFLESGIPAITFQPSASALMSNGKITRLETHPLKTVLSHRLVPVIHGDIAIDSKQGMNIASTETLFNYLAGELHPARLLLAGDLDGVYSADPQLNPDAILIESITAKNWPHIKMSLSGSQATDVTGGMYTKVKDMLQLTQNVDSATALVFSGVKAGNIEKALLGHTTNLGTTISNL